MDLRLGLVGRGYWGNTYAKLLEELGIDFWQAGRDWEEQEKPDGLIIASSTGTHFSIAMEARKMGLPVLIEKPVVMSRNEADQLIGTGGIVYAGHTRLHAPGWEAFKASLPREIKRIEVWAGGVNETNPDAFLNWVHHIIPMVCQFAAPDERLSLYITDEKQPLRMLVNGEHEFKDGPPGALKNLVLKFCQAIKEKRHLDNYGAYEAMLVQLYLKDLNTFDACGPGRWHVIG